MEWAVYCPWGMGDKWLALLRTILPVLPQRGGFHCWVHTDDDKLASETVVAGEPPSWMGTEKSGLSLQPPKSWLFLCWISQWPLLLRLLSRSHGWWYRASWKAPVIDPIANFPHCSWKFCTKWKWIHKRKKRMDYDLSSSPKTVMRLVLLLTILYELFCDDWPFLWFSVCW